MQNTIELLKFFGAFIFAMKVLIGMLAIIFFLGLIVFGFIEGYNFIFKK